MSYLDGAIGVKNVSADGTADPIPSRDTLHFKGAVTATDDDVNGETVLTFSQPEDVLPVAITPPALTVDVTTFNAANLDGAGIVRVTASAPVAVHGMEAPTATGRPRKTFAELDGSERIEFKHLSSSAPAGKRFVCPFGLSFFLLDNASIDVLYDPTAAVWRLIP